MLSNPSRQLTVLSSRCRPRPEASRSADQRCSQFPARSVRIRWCRTFLEARCRRRGPEGCTQSLSCPTGVPQARNLPPQPPARPRGCCRSCNALSKSLMGTPGNSNLRESTSQHALAQGRPAWTAPQRAASPADLVDGCVGETLATWSELLRALSASQGTSRAPWAPWHFRCPGAVPTGKGYRHSSAPECGCRRTRLSRCRRVA